ncbi:hypothetical protein DKL61_07035 [Gammaproteobacteria bacterium ESL0073]|nr:hypothetical protein DKL61_06925 [Gammaproteobacteria bacterium ESL0073]AWM80119.1 hypothetical protein DKL61_06980 [Gammaproteobacteria bacterium ESL0073]AWM80129.1 hypothetical protein DKL61_07035 [Gammaproteobacteria bacterium ESL0073]
MKEPKKYTSIRISEDRKMTLERLAIDTSYISKKSIKWTDIVNYLIDNYAKDAAQDLKTKKEV